MFKEVFRFELAYNFKRIAWWVFFGILFIVAFNHTVITDPNRVMLFAHGQVLHNSPISIARVLAITTGFGLLFTIVIVGTSVMRDFENNTHELFFSSPVGKFDYLGGRFVGGLASNLFLFLAPVLGIIAGCLSIDNAFSGPFSVQSYLYAIIVFVIPNLILMGSLFFSLAVLSRNMIATYVAGCVVIPVYLFVMGNMDQSDSRVLIAWFDPIGIGALELVTRYWSIAQKNAHPLPLDSIVLYNRLIWLAIASIIWGFTYSRFKLASKLESRTKRIVAEAVDEINTAHVFQNAKTYAQTFSWRSNVKHCLTMSFKESSRLIFHPAFLVLSAIAMLQAYRNFVGNAGPSGSNVYPLTWWFIDNGSRDLFGYMIPITVFFTGLIVWKERDFKSHEICDVLPIPNWTFYLTKLLTIWSIQFFFVLVTLLTGIGAQAIVFKYTNFEIDLYLKALIGIDLTHYFMMAVLALLVQIIAGSKYLGYFIAAALFFFIELQTFDISALFRYGTYPDYVYSNLNGFGNYAQPLIWYKIYWSGAALVFIVAGDLLWRRGSEIRIKHRWKLARQRFSGSRKWIATISGVVFLASGSWIFYNTRIVNNYHTNADRLERAADYEKKYKVFDRYIQPDITHVQIQIDLHPEDRIIYIKGFYVLKNNSTDPLDSIFINLSSEKGTRINRLVIGKNSRTVLADSDHGFYIYELAKPLMPEDSMRLEFDLVSAPKGFSENDPNNNVIRNGTFIDNFPFQKEPSYFPSIGYNLFEELRGKYEREKYGLPEMPGLLSNTDSAAIHRKVADLITFDAVISTSADQVAVATGKLDSSWSDKGRNYYHYSVRTPMNNCFVITSGRYKQRNERYQGVEVEIFYDKDHAYNIERMMNGIKCSLDYCADRFSPYPYPSLKIIEVPDWGGGNARSQPTVFTWSENGGFISNLEDSNDIDDVFNTTTHEMAHQWWGHIVRAAPVQGGKVMAETMAQWVRVMCMEREFGPVKTQRFRQQQMDVYFSRRSRETDFEPTMQDAGLQNYLSYDKGTLVMYALGNLLGEDNVNRALRNLVETFGFKTSSFVTTRDLIAELRKVTPDSLQYVITDLFERIIIYDNKMTEASYETLTDGRYKVHLSVDVRKYCADGKGNEVPAELHDYIEIGIFGKDGKQLYLRKHKIMQSPMDFDIVVDELPQEAGIDPHMIFIDRNCEDNIKLIKAGI